MLAINNDQKGFTITELMLVVVVLGIVITGIFTGFIAIYSSSSRDNRQLDLDSTAQLAMGVIERDTRYSVDFKIGISSPFSDPYGPNNSGAAWDYKGVPASSTSRILILKAYATTQNALSNTREVVYQTGTFACSQKLYNPQLPCTLIYFVRSGTLYRRILTDTTSTVCNGPQAQKQSCPPELSGSWDVICKARDEIIAENVSSFSVDYYSTQPLTLISDAYTSSAPDRLDNADDVNITLTLSKGSSNPVISSISLHVAKVNR